MKGYVSCKGDRWYAVIYEGLDPVTGREKRSWHPAGTDRADAEQLAARLAGERNGPNDEVRSLSFGAYLTTRWLPGKKLELARSTYDGYRRKVEGHILPTIGKVALRRLRPHHLEDLYDSMLNPGDGRRALAPKTVYDVHLIIRGALADAERKGLVARNIALVTHSPRRRAITKIEQRAWNAQELQAFLAAATGHRLFPAFWLSANTGMRRGELLGLRWSDIDLDKATVSTNRALIAVAYDLHESRGKTRNARRRIDLDPVTVDVLRAWHGWQHVEQTVVGRKPSGRVFTDGEGDDIHPHAISQAFKRIAHNADVPVLHLHDMRHTHATLLIKAGVPVKVVSERLGHASPTFTIETYQHVLPGMQADAARTFAALLAPASTGASREKRRRKTA